MTEKEYRLLEGIAHSECQYFSSDDKKIIEVAVWDWSAAAWAELPYKSAKGVLYFLVKKGWAKEQKGWKGENHSEDDCCWITEAGFRALQEERSRRAQHEEA